MTEAEVEELNERLRARGEPHWANVGFPPGWADLVSTLDEKIMAIDPGYEVIQVKEKYAGLRFYFRSSEDLAEADKERVRLLVDEAEARSYTLCEECGESGVLRRKGYWWVTLCEPHKGDSVIMKRES